MSVILPSYNEEPNIERAIERITGLLEKAQIPYELIFVDDGSKDRTWQTLKDCARRYPQVKGVHFSRNFGKEAAIMAGLAQAGGRCSVVMDCDLQYPPETLMEMYKKWQEGYDVVEGVKRSRGEEGVIYHAGARIFYKLLSRAVKIDMSRASDFKLMDQKVVNSLLALPEKNAFFRALSSWVGYETVQVEFDVQRREAGESKWSMWSLTKYAITNVAAFSAAPMQMVTFLGLLVFLAGIILSVQTLWHYCTGRAVEGFTTVIPLLLIIGSIIMISLGIIGYYIAKIYEEVKHRPRYIIADMTREEEPIRGEAGDRKQNVAEEVYISGKIEEND